MNGPATFLPETREKERDYDMVDGPEWHIIERSPALAQGLETIRDRLAPIYFQSDRAAIDSQRRHRWFAGVSVVVGVVVVVLAILQLTFGAADHGVGDHQSPPGGWLAGSSSAARIAELVGIVVCALAVGGGLWVAAQIGWLRDRHRAELCRLLKFRSLADPLLWNGATAEWKSEFDDNVAKIHKVDDDAVRSRAVHDPVREIPDRVHVARVEPDRLLPLAGYYLSKRIRCQRKYFEDKAQRYERTAGWLRVLPLACFYLGILAALSHFVVDLAAAWFDPEGSYASAWHVAGTTGLALAAILPVVGAGIRAYRSAHEYARSAALFHAKASAMKDFERIVAHPLETPDDAARLMRDILDCEKFLEAEHREWLRLMLESEWFG
jgi:hypothetical protein